MPGFISKNNSQSIFGPTSGENFEDLERMLRVDLVRALPLLLAVASAHARECTLSHVYNLDADDELRGGAPPLLDIMAQDIRLGGSMKYDFCAVRHHQSRAHPPSI